MENLTTENYWEKSYTDHNDLVDLRTSGFRGHLNRLIFRKILETTPANKRILEIGAGNSMWLPFLAKQFPSSSFTGVDYTKNGCSLLLDRSKKDRLGITVVQEDMFSKQSSLHNSFEIVLSFGVVEHFADLSHAMEAKKKYLTADGVIFTIIPNLSGALGALTKKWNSDVYKKHNPHDLPSFTLGHQRAGLEIIEGGYLGSNNFGVLAGCFPQKKGVNWQLNKALIALSQLSWAFESKIIDLPTTKTFSPYIYAISRISQQQITSPQKNSIAHQND